jgi:hypothetical protein
VTVMAADISRVNGEDGFGLGRIVAPDHGRRSGGRLMGTVGPEPMAAPDTHRAQDLLLDGIWGK